MTAGPHDENGGFGCGSAGSAHRRSPERGPAEYPTGERGSGTVLALALIAVVLVLALTLIALLSAHAVRTRCAVAADSAALAAADTASGRIPGDPCGRAAEVAARHGTTLLECGATRTGARVLVTTTVLGFPVTVAARAGLPLAGGSG